MNRGVAKSDLQDLAGALSDYDQAIEIRERLRQQGRLLDENDLAGAYMNRGVAKSDLQDLAGALSDYDQAIEIRERLVFEGRFWQRAGLFMTYYIAFLLFKKYRDVKALEKLGKQALSAVRAALGDGRLTPGAIRELNDLMQLMVEHPHLPEAQRQQWFEVARGLEARAGNDTEGG